MHEGESVLPPFFGVIGLRLRSARQGARCLLGLLCLVGSAAAGCRWQEPSETSASRLEYLLEVELGARPGAGYIEGRPTDVERLRDGSWVLFSALGLPRRFDSAGAFLGQLGRQGQGPGEFLAATLGARLPGDSLLVFDSRSGRATIFDESLAFARAVRWDGLVTEIMPVAWPDTVFAVLWPRGLPGRSQRLLSLAGPNSREYLTFGEPWPERDFDRFIRFRRYSTQPRDGRVWSVGAGNYQLREWSITGDSLRVLKPETEIPWVEESGFGPGAIPPTAVTAVQLLGDDVLAVALAVAREDWRLAWEGVDQSDSETKAPPETMLYRGVVEMRRRDSGEFVARGAFDGVVVEVMPDGRVVTFAEIGQGTPVVRVFRPVLGGA